MAGLEGIDATTMDIVDALGGRFLYDAGHRVAKPLVRHADRIPIARVVDEERVIEPARFGLPLGRLITNARDDKLATSPAWKGLLGKGNCLAAVSYVVERGEDATYRIQRRDLRLIVVPGLCAVRHYRFASTGNEYDDLGHVQVTAAANGLVGRIHDRFVCELDTPRKRDAWLTSSDPDELRALLRPAPDDRYEMVPISPDVWKRRDAASVEPMGPALR